MLDQLAPLDSKEEIEVCFVDVDDSKSVDLVISCLFKDHGVDDGFPSFERMSCANTEIDDCEYRSADKDLFIAEGRLAWFVGFCVWKRFDKKSFVMSKVTAGWRCGCCFTPCLDFSLKFFL